MRKLLLTTAFSTIWLLASGQSILEVTSLGTKYTEEQISNAFNSGNFCPYFYETKRNVLILDDGATLELLSKEEQGISDENCGQNDNHIFPEYVWAISTSGIVTKKSNAEFSKKAE